MLDHKTSILWIDDDEELIHLVSKYLESEGFNITSCTDGESGISLALTKKFDLIMLDIMLPTINGLHILRVLEKCTDTPVIMFTASNLKEHELTGLSSGAVDYISKPCDLDILIARINRTIKLSKNNSSEEQQTTLSFNGLCFNLKKRTVSIDERPLNLTNSEYELLKILAHHAEQVISKKDLQKLGLGKEWSPDDKNIDTHIKNIRKKIKEADDNNSLVIKTVYGFGYQLEKND